MPMSDQLKQLVELHKAAEQAMRGLIVRMWPGDSLPNSYFGLVRRLVDACPRLEVINGLSASKVHAGLLPVRRCTGPRWTPRSW